ncbi:uncharacterized protein LOC115881403 isoform X2 [Sitophilus oryzae]|uniref:Uncharacterized protein LOC115881403 isoform X2 n=1 Tax=Sitophilus oryzae TaxID=7048 RepID=A0A6J2XVU4_SITOR|nr:uncharacterized protein LOC115881403 isoform X2 [Sitophilus oryzae]
MRCAVALLDLNVQKLWINACKRLDKFNLKSARVCSKHFAEDSYERNLKYELCDFYSSKNQRILKTNAIPSLNLPSTTHNPKVNQRKKRLTKRNQPELVEEVLLDNTQNCVERDNGPPDNSSNMIVTNINIRNTDVLEVDSSSSPQSTYREISTQTDDDNRDKTILELKEEIERLKNEKRIFETIFTPNQIKKLKNPEKRASWSKEDVERAIVIHSAGAEAYRLLLKNGYPLPAESTLRAWCKKVKLELGILKPVKFDFANIVSKFLGKKYRIYTKRIPKE